VGLQVQALNGLSKLSFRKSNYDPVKAAKYAWTASNIAYDTQYRFGLASSLLWLGFVYGNMGLRDFSTQFLETSLKKFDSIQHKDCKAQCEETMKNLNKKYRR
jgi:hypothetical protein